MSVRHEMSVEIIAFLPYASAIICFETISCSPCFSIIIRGVEDFITIIKGIKFIYWLFVMRLFCDLGSGGYATHSAGERLGFLIFFFFCFFSLLPVILCAERKRRRKRKHDKILSTPKWECLSWACLIKTSIIYEMWIFSTCHRWNLNFYYTKPSGQISISSAWFGTQ